MKTTQLKLRFYTIFQWEQEQEFLRQQHEKGWKFTKVHFPGFYYFEKCEPMDVVYQLDYNPDGVSHKSTYVQMFNDCGWEYLGNYFGYSYFRKPTLEMDGDEEIFCDASSRLDFMQRVFKGRIFPLVPIFFCIILPQLFLQLHHNSFYSRLIAGFFTGVAILYLVIFLNFAIQFWKYQQASKH